MSTESDRVSYPPMVAKKSKLPLDIYCFSCLFVFSFVHEILVLPPSIFSRMCSHKERNPNVSSSSCFFLFKIFFFFGRLYLSLNLPCFCFFPEPGPPPSVSHKAISSSILRCIYYRGLAQTSTRRRRVKVTCLLCCPCRLPHTP